MNKENKLNLGSVSGSFYENFNDCKITVRRASDNALLEVDMMNDEHCKKRLKDFCKGNDRYLSNYH